MPGMIAVLRQVPSFMFRPRRQPQRWLLAVLAVVAGLAHVPLIPPHLSEAPYMGVLFILLTIACLMLAGAATFRDSAAVYSTSAAVCGVAVIGYVATRLVPFPMLADEVGNWLEPLGLLAVPAETAVVVIAVRVLLRASRHSFPGAGPSSTI
jgi:peptidoglycan/LPS O-acetylase OafA/YrhL